MKYLLAFSLLNGLLMVHELGHWAFAALFRIRVTRVALGFGPPILAVAGKPTRLLLNAVPLGMFLHFSEEPLGGWSTAAAWRRGVVLLGGPIFNGILGLALLSALYLSGTHVPVPLTVGTVQPGSEAARAQIRPGDQLVAIDGKPLSRWSDLTEYVSAEENAAVRLEILRDTAPQSVVLIPRLGDDGHRQLGLSEQHVYKQHGFKEAIDRSWSHAGALFLDLAGQIRHPARPAQIFQRALDLVTRGPDGFLRLTASCSLALAFFYLLPLPGLDGGRLTFVAVEVLRGRAPSAQVETAVHALGFIGLLAACVLFALAGS